MDVAHRHCACGSHRTLAAFSCDSCGRSWSHAVMVSNPGENLAETEGGVSDYVSKLIAGALSGALTGVFAVAGALTGALTGALASRTSDCGLVHGVGVGAIAGAVLSIEVLEASRAYWSLEQSGTRSTSPMADFIEELLRGRFIEQPFSPATHEDHNWQVRVSNSDYTGNYEGYGETPFRGLSGELLNKLPCSLIMEDVKSSQSICCSICLQDFEIGELARSLPRCQHRFHMECVDKWLRGHDSCPVCRRVV